ncbi:MAG: hypothetical protein ACR2MO_03860 [Acidimicrobiales bacterium]
MAKSVVLSLFPSTARVVDVACGACGEGVGLVTESANGPWLTVWAPAADASAGETQWAMAAGPLPRDEHVNVQCFDHGHGKVDPGALLEKVDRFRSEGACQRLPVQLGRNDS